jgi:hypothetical protein
MTKAWNVQQLLVWQDKNLIYTYHNHCVSKILYKILYKLLVPKKIKKSRTEWCLKNLEEFQLYRWQRSIVNEADDFVDSDSLFLKPSTMHNPTNALKKWKSTSVNVKNKRRQVFIIKIRVDKVDKFVCWSCKFCDKTVTKYKIFPVAILCAGYHFSDFKCLFCLKCALFSRAVSYVLLSSICYTNCVSRAKILFSHVYNSLRLYSIVSATDFCM